MKHVEAGNKVVMHWRKGAGIEADFPRYRFKAEPDRSFTGGRVTTFMEYAVCSENRLTAVDHNAGNDLCALLGCSLSTALATLEYEAKLMRGENILIVGCGGLGASLIVAARLSGARMIVVNDVAPKEKLALSLGAHAFSDSWTPAGTRHRGYNVIVETSGDVDAIDAALPLLAPGGRFIQVGQPVAGRSVSIHNALHFFDGEGKSYKATQGGGFRPEKDCARYIDFFDANPDAAAALDRIVSDRFPLDEINRAIEHVKRGNAGRVLIDIG